MNQWLEPGSQDAHVQAEALAKELSRKGFGIVIYTTGGHQVHPCIQVTTPTWWFTEVTEFIYVAPGDDGGWQFWWSPWMSVHHDRPY